MQTRPTMTDITALDAAEATLIKLGDPAAAATVRQARVAFAALLSETERAELSDAERHRQAVSIYSSPGVLSSAQRETLVLLGTGGRDAVFTLRSLGRRSVSATWLADHKLAALTKTSNGPGIMLSDLGLEVFARLYPGLGAGAA